MTILTRYQADMDQILSNFIPYCDPYIVISWKLPKSNYLKKETIPYEIRSEVLWGGTVSINYPQDIAGSQSFRITAETEFTIKGWMFKDSGEIVKRIYTIHSDYSTKIFDLDDQDTEILTREY